MLNTTEERTEEKNNQSLLNMDILYCAYYRVTRIQINRVTTVAKLVNRLAITIRYVSAQTASFVMFVFDSFIFLWFSVCLFFWTNLFLFGFW